METICMATGQANAEIMRGGCPTLNTNHEQPIVMGSHKQHSGLTEDGTCTTLTAQEKERPIVGSTVVRRLTPLECERLQGYPDGWTLIGDPVEEDVADYETVFDESKYVEPKPEDFGLTAEDVENIMRIEDDTRECNDDDIDPEEYGDERYNEYLRAVDKAKAKATKRIKVGSHKEVNYYYTDCNGKRKKVCDSQRYKALGNSIALLPWKWIMKRICACYERDATLASLFDGIGGFPLIWEQINGKGSCIWASEIEEFPMAVTKARFGDE